MGRSPVLATSSTNVLRAGSSVMSSAAAGMISPGIIARSHDRMMYGHELRAIGERGLHLDLGDHLGDAVHDLCARQQLRALAHELRDRFAIACAFHDGSGKIRDRFGVIQSKPA